MKKILAISLVLALAAMLVPSIVFADGPTEISTDWTGGGSVGGVVTSGNDSTASFFTGGDFISGSFRAKDSNDNPYTYNVDTTQAFINAQVGDLGSDDLPGVIQFQMNRTDSLASMYGDPGQSSFSQLVVYNGSGAMATGSWTNFANEKDPLYSSTGQILGIPWRTSGGHNFEANASYFDIVKQIDSSDADVAYVNAYGSGSAWLDCMCSEMGSEKWGTLRLGRGCGCYTDADFSATGVGTFDVGASANNWIDVYGYTAATKDTVLLTIPGDGSAGSATYKLVVEYAGTFGLGNYSLEAK